MKKLIGIAVLVSIVISLFLALPAAAQGNCDPSVDYEELGHEQLHHGEYEAALNSIDCALSFDNDNFHLLMMRAEVFCHDGRPALAVEAFTRAAQVQPLNAYAWNNRGWAYYMLGDFAAAMTDFNYALSLNPELAYAYNNRGLVWQQMGEYQNARADFQKALDLGFEQPWAAINLYNLEFETRNLES